MHRTRNTVIVLAILVATIASAVFIARRNGSDAVAVPMEKIAYRAFTVKLPENGVVMRPAVVTIPTLISGNIGRIYVREGDRVTKGELLATIENPTVEFDAAGSQADYASSAANVNVAKVNEQNARVQYQAQVDTDASTLKEAQRVYAADAALLAQRAIARSQVDADKAKLEQAQVAYDQAVQQLRLGAVNSYGQDSVQYAKAAAEKSKILNEENQQQLSFTRILAPSDGTIETVASEASDALRSLQPGDAVSAGQALFKLATAAGYIVKAEVDEQDIINVKLGQRVVVSGEDFPNVKIPGHVAYIAPVAVKSADVSSTAKQVLTTIALERSPSFLKDGMSADVDILTTDVPHAISVPNGAVFKEGSTSYVYTVRAGVAKKRAVKVGQVGDTATRILAGLSPGDVVVTKPSSIKDGAHVTPMPSPTGLPSAS
jgi:RND family efflux transporter MFP subunit